MKFEHRDDQSFSCFTLFHYFIIFNWFLNTAMTNPPLASQVAFQVWSSVPQPIADITERTLVSAFTRIDKHNHTLRSSSKYDQWSALSFYKVFLLWPMSLDSSVVLHWVPCFSGTKLRRWEKNCPPPIVNCPHHPAPGEDCQDNFVDSLLVWFRSGFWNQPGGVAIFQLWL